MDQAACPQALSSGTGVRRVPGNIRGEKLSISATFLWKYQLDCRTKPHVPVTFCPLCKKCQLENELISVDYTLKVGESSFRMCGISANPDSSRSKFAVVGLQDQLAHHTYIAAPSFHVQSASQNSTQLQMPRRQGVQL